MMKPMVLTEENLSDIQTEIERSLSSLNVAEKDILRTQLLVEEISLRMINYGHAAQVNVQVVKQFFGKIQIRMTAEGIAYNPLVEVTDLNEDDDDYYAMMILKAHRQRLNWFHDKGCNVVIIDGSGETNKQLWFVAASIVGGLICGFILKEFCSPETIEFVKEVFITPIQTIFLNALNMVIAPVIFFSVLSGIIGMGNSAGVSKIGTELIGLCLSNTAIAVVIGLGIAQIVFSGNVPQIGTIPSEVNANVAAYEFSLIQFAVSIIPKDLISPIIDGDYLKIIFVATLFGSCLNSLEDKVRLLQELVNNCNEFFMKFVSMIILFVPLISFFAMIFFIVDMSVEVISAMGKFLLGIFFSGVITLGLYALMLMFFGKTSPTTFLKKIPEVCPIPFVTSSSNVSMPSTMNFCIKRLGILPKITSFAIPIATIVNSNGTCVYISLLVFMFLKMYGINVDFDKMLIIFAMTMSLTAGAPGMPNGTVIRVLTITVTFGVPSDIAGILFCIDAIFDRIITCFNVTGSVAVTMILAGRENLLNEKIYFGKRGGF
ncbi:MAG: dicarboxylate/amino acid:cation symporter [Quinella sp. 1Q5]|nr:dicarboxylate/amino acid:cation symporter [Quinella sp. 1Q5]